MLMFFRHFQASFWLGHRVKAPALDPTWLVFSTEAVQPAKLSITAHQGPDPAHLSIPAPAFRPGNRVKEVRDKPENCRTCIDPLTRFTEDGDG